jgi:RNA polymerase sigma-70 factor (ECF subfamily)
MQGLEELTTNLYRELRSLAAAAMRRERNDHTLQPTALVHEAYLRLSGSSSLQLTDRKQFLAIAARIMRQVLVEHARARGRVKRGSAPLRVTLAEGVATTTPSFDLLALDEALERLGRLDDQQVRIVELRYLAGLSVEETATVLGLSTTTIKRDAAMAKAWLQRELATTGTSANPSDDSAG